MWDEVAFEKWNEVPFISGRVATEEDVKNESAVFHIPTGSEPYDTELPLFAVQLDEETNERIPCIVIQLENTAEGTIVGVRYFNGGNGIGKVDDFEFYNEPPKEFGL